VQLDKSRVEKEFTELCRACLKLNQLFRQFGLEIHRRSQVGCSGVQVPSPGLEYHTIVCRLNILLLVCYTHIVYKNALEYAISRREKFISTFFVELINFL